jgi:hypothetical protein
VAEPAEPPEVLALVELSVPAPPDPGSAPSFVAPLHAMSSATASTGYRRGFCIALHDNRLEKALL